MLFEACPIFWGVRFSELQKHGVMYGNRTQNILPEFADQTLYPDVHVTESPIPGVPYAFLLDQI